MKEDCDLAGRCSGCPWILVPYDEQLERKKTEMAALLQAQGLSVGSIELESIGTTGLRQRADLTWQRQGHATALGLYGLRNSREIVDMQACPMMTPGLEAWLKDFRENTIDLEKGSVRLRVSPSGERGVWLDLKHIDVKRLLEEGEWLSALMTKAHVEVGQRFKPLVRKQGKLKLEATLDPRPWFETYLGTELRATPLYGVIGSFTQPGFTSNRALVAGVVEVLAERKTKRVLELFSGLGNFTLPIASLGCEVTTFEGDPISVSCLERTLVELPELRSRISFGCKDLYTARGIQDIQSLSADAIVVDPPRSGLKHVLDNTAAPLIIYVSCFAKTMASDLACLVAKGYRLSRLKGIDQFPGSPHCEWIAVLESLR